MIGRIDGELAAVREGHVELRCGAITYEVLTPTADLERLAARIGEPMSLHTLHYLESQSQGAAYVPRLLGFGSARQRAFFEVLTSVKGLGPRKTLRALDRPYQEIASAIARGDVELLTTLPEIGRRLAETIVAQLRGKVDRFIEGGPAEVEVPVTAGAAVTDALAAMVRLGEPRAQARLLIDRALREDPALRTADALLTAALRMKEPG